MSSEPHHGLRATVREVNGQVVLDDPDACAVAHVVAKYSGEAAKYKCRLFFEQNAERVAHWKRRIEEIGSNGHESLIVLLNADDPSGGPLAKILMPRADWSGFRERGQTPVAAGIVTRRGMQDVVNRIDREAGDKLAAMVGVVAVVVVDHGTAEVFRA